LPEAIRLFELRARVPRYQRDMLQYLARQNDTSASSRRSNGHHPAAVRFRWIDEIHAELTRITNSILPS
jgi:hypothetical protein